MPASHPIDVLFDAAAAGAAVEIPQGWGQGRAIFGGVVAGVLQARSLAAYELDPATLRATTTSFVAPASPGPARVESILLRQGSSATQTETRLWQRDERTGEETIRGVQLSAYGLPRASAVDLPAARPAQAPPDPDRLVALPYLPGFTPAFLAVTAATSLAFFAMVGFEDSVNMAEETQDPVKNFPKMMITGIGMTMGNKGQLRDI